MSGLLEGEEALSSWGVQESKRWTGGQLMRREGTSPAKKVFQDDNLTRQTCSCKGCAENRVDQAMVARLREGGSDAVVLGEPKACKLSAKWDALEAGGA